MFRSLLIIALLLCGAVRAAQTSIDSAVLEDLRSRIADCQSSQESLRTELQILADRMDRLKAGINSADTSKDRLSQLEGRVAAVERQYQAAAADLRQLNVKLDSESETTAKVADQLAQRTDNLKNALESIVQLQQHTQPGKELCHTVQSGETLEKIARRYKSSIKALRETNGLKSDRIYVGQTLRIPQNQASG